MINKDDSLKSGSSQEFPHKSPVYEPVVLTEDEKRNAEKKLHVILAKKATKK